MNHLAATPSRRGVPTRVVSPCGTPPAASATPCPPPPGGGLPHLLHPGSPQLACACACLVCVCARVCACVHSLVQAQNAISRRAYGSMAFRGTRSTHRRSTWAAMSSPRRLLALLRTARVAYSVSMWPQHVTVRVPTVWSGTVVTLSGSGSSTWPLCCARVPCGAVSLIIHDHAMCRLYCKNPQARNGANDGLNYRAFSPTRHYSFAALVTTDHTPRARPHAPVATHATRHRAQSPPRASPPPAPIPPPSGSGSASRGVMLDAPLGFCFAQF